MPDKVVSPPILETPVQVIAPATVVAPLDSVLIKESTTKSGLTVAQTDAIIGLLRAFNVDQATITIVEAILR
mgnify:CR=1 FL=1